MLNYLKNLLKKIRIIRHIEMEQMLANQFSQINLSNPHALIEENQKNPEKIGIKKENLLVIVDDIALPFGKIRLKKTR